MTEVESSIPEPKQFKHRFYQRKIPIGFAIMEEKDGSISEASTVEAEAINPIEEDLLLLRLEILAMLIRQNIQETVPILRQMWQTDPASRPDIDAMIPEIAESIVALYRFGAYRQTVLSQREARRNSQQEGSQSDNEEGKEEGQN